MKVFKLSKLLLSLSLSYSIFSLFISLFLSRKVQPKAIQAIWTSFSKGNQFSPDCCYLSLFFCHSLFLSLPSSLCPSVSVYVSLSLSLSLYFTLSVSLFLSHSFCLTLSVSLSLCFCLFLFCVISLVLPSSFFLCLFIVFIISLFKSLAFVQVHFLLDLLLHPCDSYFSILKFSSTIIMQSVKVYSESIFIFIKVT